MSSEIFENREEDFKVLVEDARTKLRTQASRATGGNRKVEGNSIYFDLELDLNLDLPVPGHKYIVYNKLLSSYHWIK